MTTKESTILDDILTILLTTIRDQGKHIISLTKALNELTVVEKQPFICKDCNSIIHFESLYCHTCGKIRIDIQSYKDKLEALTVDGDIKIQHSLANDLLCEILLKFGLEELVDIYDKINKKGETK